MNFSIPAVPPGFRLSRAVLTTYDLDIASAEELLRGEDIQKYIIVRGNADRGCGGPDSPELEKRILDTGVPVSSPDFSGAAHAKIWVFEYDGGSAGMMYRALVLSENICSYGGRSLEIAASFIGTPCGVSQNSAQQLCLLLRSFRNRGPAEKDRLAGGIRAFSDVLQYVRFEPEKPFSGGTSRIIAFGMGSPARNILINPLYSMVSGCRRFFMMSPFLTEDFLDMVGAGTAGSIILATSRDTLKAVSPGCLDGFTVYCTEKGLFPHAKIFISEKEDGIELLFGSSNATAAALRYNLEAMVYFKNPAGIRSVEDALDAWRRGCLPDFSPQGQADVYARLGLSHACSP